MHGSLIRWNDLRGIGAIAPVNGDEPLFVHVSAFPRDGIRPRIGELLSYEVEPGSTGVPHAMRLQRLGSHGHASSLFGRTGGNARARMLWALLATLAAAGFALTAITAAS